MLQKICSSNKCCSFELSINQRILKNSQKTERFFFFLKDRNTEDWSNDAENTALITGINSNLIYIHIENKFTVFTVFLIK